MLLIKLIKQTLNIQLDKDFYYAFTYMSPSRDNSLPRSLCAPCDGRISSGVFLVFDLLLSRALTQKNDQKADVKV